MNCEPTQQHMEGGKEEEDEEAVVVLEDSHHFWLQSQHSRLNCLASQVFLLQPGTLVIVHFRSQLKGHFHVVPSLTIHLSRLVTSFTHVFYIICD